MLAPRGRFTLDNTWRYVISRCEPPQPIVSNDRVAPIEPEEITHGPHP